MYDTLQIFCFLQPCFDASKFMLEKPMYFLMCECVCVCVCVRVRVCVRACMYVCLWEGVVIMDGKSN